MGNLMPAALRRLAWGLGVAVGVLAGTAHAQSVDATYISKTCSGCHSPVGQPNDPPELAALIDFSDATLFSSLSNFIARITKTASNTTMKNFGNGVTSTAQERQDVYDYLVNVRNAVVSADGTTFGATNVGATNGTTRTVTLVNYRDEALEFTPSLSNSTDFGMSTTCPSGPRRVAARSSCTVSITFTPSQGTATSRSSTLTIDFTSGTSFVPTDRTIVFTGTVNPPVFGFTAGAGPFTARVNVASDINFGTVRNTGSATLAMSSITENPASVPFSLSPTDLVNRPLACSGSSALAANGTCQLWVRFTPSAAGSASATFRFAHNAGGGTNDVTVTASGVQPLIDPTSAALNFGSVQQGATSPAQTVTLNNVGTMAYTFTADPKAGAALGGANPTDFSVTTSCNSAAGQTVAAGAGCTLSISFTPPLAAPAGVERTATLTVNTDADNNTGVLSVSLRGTPSTLPEPTLALSSSADYPDTVIGQTSAPTTRVVTLTNTRTHAIGYSYTVPTDFQVTAESCSSGAPPNVPADNGTCTITFVFAPGLAGLETRRTGNVPFTFTGTSGDPAPGALSASLAGRALLPIAAPATLSPSARVTIPGTASTVLTNRSNAAVTLNTLVFSGAAAAEYSLDATNTCTAGLSLASGGTCTLVVKLDPSVAGARNATLTLNHGALGSPQDIVLNGTATPAPQGAILLSGFSLSFADTQLNASSALSLTVQNSGDLALNFSAFNLSGAAAADYVRSGSCAVGTPLAIGQQCTLTVTFHPTALGVRAASLAILSDASNGTATVSITGTGVPIPAPRVSFVPTSLDFGAQTVGNPYPTRTIRLVNSGTADLHASSVTVTGAAFATASNCAGTLAPGDGCDVAIGFQPTTAGTDYTGSLRVVSDAAGSPHTAALAGHGSAAQLAALTWSPLVTQLDFGTVAAGTLSPAQTAVLRNQGPGGVTLTVLNAVGADAASFAVTGGTCAVGGTLFEGDTCTVSVQFAPSVAGAREAQLQVASSGSFPPVLMLKGTGLGGPAPGAALSVTALDLGTIRVGNESAPSEVVLSSTGSGTLHVSALAARGPFTVTPKSCPGVPFSLPAGSSCSVTVTFAPDGTGAMQGALQITADAGTLEVALSGQGEPAADLSSGGGCSLADGDRPVDPTLWTLVLLAAAVLLARRRARRGR